MHLLIRFSLFIYVTVHVCFTIDFILMSLVTLFCGHLHVQIRLFCLRLVWPNRNVWFWSCDCPKNSSVGQVVKICKAMAMVRIPWCGVPSVFSWYTCIIWKIITVIYLPFLFNPLICLKFSFTITLLTELLLMLLTMYFRFSESKDGQQLWIENVNTKLF